MKKCLEREREREWEDKKWRKNRELKQITGHIKLGFYIMQLGTKVSVYGFVVREYKVKTCSRHIFLKIDQMC